MQVLFVFVLTLLIPTHSLAAPADADKAYQQPHPHSSGADLLYYCEKADMVVDQLRCDYYVQGVADLATIPQQGTPMACIPQGQSRTQLMAVALQFLQSSTSERLESNSAASLILKAFKKAFPCPNQHSVQTKGKGVFGNEANPELAAVMKKCAAIGGDAETLKQCVIAGDKELKARKKSGWDNLSPEQTATVKACVEAGGDPATVKQCIAGAGK